MEALCACCARFGYVEPFVTITFTIHRGPVCSTCYRAWVDPTRTCDLSALPCYVPITDPQDRRLLWPPDAYPAPEGMHRSAP
jgi:hypothetical protein